MKKTLILIILLALVGWGIYAWSDREGADTGTEGVNGMVVRGTITGVDFEQAMMDGPYVLIIETEDGAEREIHVPSMGIRLCTNPDAIEYPTEFKVGDRVEAKGALAADGTIVPCEGADHYLRAI